MILGAIQVYQGLTKVLASQVYYLSSNKQEDWLLFYQQLGRELEGADLVKVDQDKLYVTKADKQLAFGKSKGDDFRKTNADGRGYQPMVFGLENSAISQVKNLITIQLRFESGLERTFIYAFED